MLLIICVERLLHIGSNFSLKKMAAAASFSYKIGSSGIIFLQNWWWWRPAASFSYKIGGGGKDLAILLAAVLTWSGYWPAG